MIARGIFRQPFYRPSGIRVELNFRDLWWGVFWKRNRWPTIVTNADHPGWQYHVYVCFVPCLPIHIWWARPGAKTWLELDAERANRPWVGGTIPDTTRTWVKPKPTSPRPHPAPGSPFAPPPDVPPNPSYDEKGIRPDWPHSPRPPREREGRR